MKIKAVKVTIKGQPAIGLPDRSVTVEDLNFDMDVIAEEDHQSMLDYIENQFHTVFQNIFDQPTEVELVFKNE